MSNAVGPTARARRARRAKRQREAKSVYQQVDERDGFKCRCCGLHDERYNHRHHITYRSHGGAHTTQNVVTLCVLHHQQVHAGRLKIVGDANGELRFIFKLSDHDSASPI